MEDLCKHHTWSRSLFNHHQQTLDETQFRALDETVEARIYRKTTQKPLIMWSPIHHGNESPESQEESGEATADALLGSIHHLEKRNDTSPLVVHSGQGERSKLASPDFMSSDYVL